MKTNLEIYISNHLSGAAIAIELLHALEEKHRDEALGSAVRKLTGEILADREALRGIAGKSKVTISRWKEVMARWSARMARRRLRKADRRNFSTFEALEVLSLGIAGKEALWRALDAAASANDQDRQLDSPFSELIKRAQEQRVVVETFRLELAASLLAFGGKQAKS